AESDRCACPVIGGPVRGSCRATVSGQVPCRMEVAIRLRRTPDTRRPPPARGSCWWLRPASFRLPVVFRSNALPTGLQSLVADTLHVCREKQRLFRRRALCSATLTGLEPATSAVTGRRANQLRHRALLLWFQISQSYTVPPTGFEPVSPP